MSRRKIRRRPRHAHNYQRLDPDSIEACKHCGEARSEAGQHCTVATEHEWQWTSGLWEKVMPPHIRWKLRNDPVAYEQVKRVLTETLEAQADKYSRKFREEAENGFPEGWRDRVLAAGKRDKPS